MNLIERLIEAERMLDAALEHYQSWRQCVDKDKNDCFVNEKNIYMKNKAAYEVERALLREEEIKSAILDAARKNKNENG